MVDPEPGHPSGADEPEDEAVRLGEDFGVLHANGGQLVDVEEATVIDFLARHAPEREPVRLLAQEVVEQIERARIGRRAVEAPQGLIEERPHLGYLTQQGRQTLDPGCLVLGSRPRSLRVLVGGRREARKPGGEGLQLQQAGVRWPQVGLQVFDPVAEDPAVGVRGDRQGRVVVPHGEDPFVQLEAAAHRAPARCHTAHRGPAAEPCPPARAWPASSRCRTRASSESGNHSPERPATRRCDSERSPCDWGRGRSGDPDRGGGGSRRSGRRLPRLRARHGWNCDRRRRNRESSPSLSRRMGRCSSPKSPEPRDRKPVPRRRRR